MLLDYVRPVGVYEVGFTGLLCRGLMLSGLCAFLLYIAYYDENPTSFVYLTFGGLIFATKLRLSPSKIFEKAKMTPKDIEDLEIKVRDNEELYTTGYADRIMYLIFVLVVAVIFGCSLAYSKLDNESDIYPFFQFKPEETKTKNLIIVFGLSLAIFCFECYFGNSYHWNELILYETFKVNTLITIIDYVMIYLILTFSNQLKFSIFSLIFFIFVLATITAFIFSLLSGSKNSSVRFNRYIVFLKWLTFAGMVVIYSKKSYKKFIELVSQTVKDDFIKDLMDQFIDKEENFDRILILFVLSSLRLFFSEVVHAIDSIKEVIHSKPDIDSKSYFVTYFIQNILGVMHHRGSDIINYNGTFLLDYFYELEQSEAVEKKLHAVFSKVKMKITLLQKYILFAKKILQGIIAVTLDIIKTHTVVIFQIILAYLIIKNNESMMLMIMPIIWCMLSFVAFGPIFATTSTIIFLYVPAAVAILHLLSSNILCKKNGVIYKLLRLEGYCNFMGSYPILSDNINGSPEDEKTKLFILLVLTIIYTILLIEKKKKIKLVVSSVLVSKMSQMAVQVKSDLYQDMVLLLRFIVSETFSNFYYICLIFLFLGIIQTISIFNLIFIGFFFYFILNSDQAKKYWLFLLLYLQFLLIIRFLYSLKIFTFSLDRETSAMIGFFFGTGTPANEQTAMWSYWLVLIAISIQYQLFHTKLAQEYKDVELKFKTTWMEQLRQMGVEIKTSIHAIYLNTIIWIFHFTLFLILIYSERTIFNVILIIMEGVFFAIHLNTSRKAATIERRKLVNQFWMVIVITILLFAFLFYIFLFCKYTVIRRFITGIIGLDPNQTQKSWSVLNPRVASEFPMLYLLKERSLQIEEKSFIRENLKVLIAFVCFFKIFHEKKSIEEDIKADEEEKEELKAAAASGNYTTAPDDSAALLNNSNLSPEVTKEAKSGPKPRRKESEEFKFNKLKATLDQILVYLSHLMKSVILFLIMIWNLEGPNVFKIIILFAILATFFRYLSSTTSLMIKSRLLEVLEKKLKYFSDNFVRKFEMELQYPELDLHKMSDHYTLANTNYYHALRNQFSLINTQISNVLYLLVFHLSWTYFVYVYIRQIFSSEVTYVKGGTEKLLEVLLSTPIKDENGETNFRHEQFISFLLVSFLILESKIIETVGIRFGKIEEQNPEKIDTEACAANLLAHLDLYIAKRHVIESAASLALFVGQLSTGRAQSTLNAASNIVANELVTGATQAAPPKPDTSNSKTADSSIEDKLENLKTRIDTAYETPSLSALLLEEANSRIESQIAIRKINERQDIDSIPNEMDIKLYLNETTSYHDKLIFFNVIKDKFSMAQLTLAFMKQMQRIGIVFLIINVSFSPSIPNVFLVFIIFALEMMSKEGYSSKISLFCGIACLLILKDDILIMLSALKWFGLLDIQKKIDNNENWWRFIFNSDSKVIIFSTIFLFLSNLFVLFSIGISKAILVDINTYTFNKNKVYWSFLEGKSKKGKKTLRITVDHKQWVSEEGNIALGLQNIAYIYPLEIYLIIMTLVVTVLPQSFTTFVLIFVMIPYIISIWDFKKKESRAKYERWYFVYYIWFCWLILVFFYPIALVLFPNTFTWNGLSPDFSLPLIILINKTYQDFLYMEDYTEYKAKLKSNKSLLSTLINTCNTYNANEDKLRENLCIFLKQSAVIECTEKISTADTEPRQVNTKLVENLFSYDNSVSNVIYQKAPFWEKYAIETFTFMYKFLLRLNYPEIFESLFYLYSNFKNKNRKVLEEQGESEELNINSFLKLDVETLDKNIQKTDDFYKKLREKDHEMMSIFEQKLKEIELNAKKLDKEAEVQESLETCNENIQAFISGMDKVPVEKEDEEDASEEVEKDRKINHSEAVSIMMNYLETATKVVEVPEENFSFNLKKGEDLVFTNIQPYFVEQTNHFTKFDFFVVFKLVVGLIVSNMDMIIIFLMTAIHVWAGGIYAIIVFTLVFFILVEERVGRFLLWMIIAAVYFVVILAILSLQKDNLYIVVSGTDNKLRSGLPTEFRAQMILLILGKLSSIYGVTLIFFMIILLRINYEKLGFYNKDILAVENLPMAVHRIIINGDFYELFDSEILHEKQRIVAVQTKILEPLTKSNDSNSLTWSYIFKLESERIIADQTVQKKRDLYIRYGYKVVTMLRRDMFRIYDEVTTSFFWRNFSKYTYKPGKNFQTTIFFCLTAIILLVVVFYPHLLNTTKDFTEIFFENYVRTDFLLILIGYTLILAFERYLSCLINPDVLIGSFRSQERIQKVMDKEGTVEKRNLMPIERFIKIIWKVKLIIRIKKVRRGEGLVEPTRNPLMRKLYLTLVLWAGVCILVYFLFPIIGNRDTRVNGFKKILCNDYYLEQEITFGINKCHTLWKGDFYYCLFFLLNILYMYYSALQIRYGFNQMRETIITKDWQSNISFINFKLYESLPLLREINTTIEFSAANTSLTYFEWLKMEDIRGAMIAAKYQAERRMEKVVGAAINGFVKICIGFSALVIVVLIIVSPLLLFSELNPSHQLDTVQRARMDVDLIFERMGNFTLLSDLHMVAVKDGLGTTQKLEFSTIMENSMPFTPESIQNLAALLNKVSAESNSDKKLSIYLRVNLQIKTQLQEKMITWTNYNPASPNPAFDMKDKAGITSALSESLSKKCETTGLVTQIYLASIPAELSIKDDKINFSEKNTKFPLILSIRCSEDGRKFISAAKNKNSLVITDCRFENATKLLKKIPKLNSASIIGLYIFIFITIGKGFIQPLLFGNAIHIWIRKAPNSLMVLLILEGMEAARANLNLFREKALFYRLIDLIRSPKALVKLTGSMLETKKAELRARLTKDRK